MFVFQAAKRRLSCDSESRQRRQRRRRGRAQQRSLRSRNGHQVDQRSGEKFVDEFRRGTRVENPGG